LWQQRGDAGTNLLIMTGTTQWPTWHLDKTDDGVRAAKELTRYVTGNVTPPAEALDTRWIDIDIDDDDSVDVTERREWGRERARALYEALRARRIPYSNPPRTDGDDIVDRQRLRTPEETLRGPATCVEFALIFAAMAMEADMRPLLAVTFGSRDHAQVVLDLEVPLSWSLDRDGPPGFVADDGPVLDGGPPVPGGWRSHQAALPSDPGRRWLTLNVTQAAVILGREDISGDFKDATRWFDPDDGERWALADVDLVRQALPAFVPPPPEVAPAIHAYLPTHSTFREYSSRQRLLTGLRGDLSGPQGRIIVLHGLSGTGKSMIGLKLATGADDGCGWFLDANGTATLRTSLAQAELAEQSGVTGERLEEPDRRSLAAAARRRLHDSTAPWVVVADNCDVGPDAAGLVELLPVPRCKGQTLIITTTDEKWVHYADRSGDLWSARTVPPLDETDVTKDLPAATVSAVDGRPLILEALRALRARRGEIGTDLTVDGPALVWTSLLESSSALGLAQDPSRLTRTARLIAAIAPVPVPLGPQTPNRPGLPSDDVETLAQLGIVVRSITPTGEPLVRIHQLFAATIRAHAKDRDARAGADVIHTLLTDESWRRTLFTSPDLDAVKRLISEDLPWVCTFLTDRRTQGLLFHGAGRVRERRGPVSGSLPLFRQALERLDRETDPYEWAESVVGVTRAVSQDKDASSDDKLAAQADLAPVGDVLAALCARSDDAGREARQLREQARALYLVMERRFAGAEPQVGRRVARLEQVIRDLRDSYAARLLLVRPPEAVDPRIPPTVQDGVPADRAYFNLAGAYVELGKAKHALARREKAADSRNTLLSEAENAFEQAWQVYDSVRQVRESRYRHYPHPHTAACIQGGSWVRYYQALLLGRWDYAATAVELADQALLQRLDIARGQGGSPRDALRDAEVVTSVDFLAKLASALVRSSRRDPETGFAKITRIVAEGVEEFGWGLQTPSRLPTGARAPEGALRDQNAGEM
jgi:tetratricopeptide (TPR) repeat protein